MAYISKIEEDALEFIESFERSIGHQYFPEELHAPAFELVLRFGKIALAVQGTEAPPYGDTPEETAIIDRLADASLNIGAVLIRKIPPTSLTKLEREGRTQLKPKQPTLEPGNEDDSDEKKPATMDERITSAFQSNIGQALSYLDLGRLIFPEDSSPNLYSRSYNAFLNSRRNVHRALLAEDLVLKRTTVVRAHHGRPRKLVAFVAEPLPEAESSSSSATPEETSQPPATDPEKERHIFTWEYELERLTRQALGILEGAGHLSDDAHQTIKINNRDALEKMLEHGLINEKQLMSGQLPVPQAVKAILLRSNDARRFMLRSETRSRALRNIDNQVKKTLEALQED